MLLILAGNKNIHKCLNEFELWPVLATDYGVSCPSASKNRCHIVFSFAIDRVLFKVAGNDDMHNILDEFEFQQDRTEELKLPLRV